MGLAADQVERRGDAATQDEANLFQIIDSLCPERLVKPESVRRGPSLNPVGLAIHLP